MLTRTGRRVAKGKVSTPPTTKVRNDVDWDRQPWHTIKVTANGKEVTLDAPTHMRKALWDLYPKLRKDPFACADHTLHRMNVRINGKFYDSCYTELLDGDVIVIRPNKRRGLSDAPKRTRKCK